MIIACILSAMGDACLAVTLMCCFIAADRADREMEREELACHENLQKGGSGNMNT